MKRSRRTSRATVLLLVLVVVAMLSVVAVSELFLMRSELGAHTAFRHGLQARAAAMSGIYRAIAALTAPPEEAQDTRDNPALFQAQRVTPAEGGQWYFTVYAENPADPGTLRYGVEDEAGKINLNTATEEMLAALPGMTPQRVDCLLDFRDGDSETRPNGAEQDYYDSLPRPYKINNGPLLTPETLLLVKGFNGSVVLGEDANRNGMLEPNEDDSAESFPPDDGNGQLDTGLRTLVTCISYEPDVDSEGNPRINVNGEPSELERQLRRAGLGEQTVKFIVRARKNGVTFPDPSALLGMTLELPDPNRRGQKTPISSGVDRTNLDIVMDKLTAGPGAAGRGRARVGRGRQAFRFGRVNINTAPLRVLSALPGIDENTAQQILDLRASLDEQTKSTTAWLYTQNVVSADVFKKLAPLVTARSYQFRVRSFGYSPARGRFCVLEAVIDLARGGPRILYLRELTSLGVPFRPAGEER